MDRPAVAADERRADFSLRLVAEICRRTNLRIDMYQRASAGIDTGDRSRPARDFRYLVNIEERDRRILEVLIDRLSIA
jgi:hypothetical protein